MSLPLPLSAPLPLVRPHRLPLSRLRCVRRHHGRVRAAALFTALLVERGIPNVDLADSMGVSEKCVRQMRSGEIAIAVGDVFALARREALAFLDAVRAEVLAVKEH